VCPRRAVNDGLCALFLPRRGAPWPDEAIGVEGTRVSDALQEPGRPFDWRQVASHFAGEGALRFVFGGERFPDDTFPLAFRLCPRCGPGRLRLFAAGVLAADLRHVARRFSDARLSQRWEGSSAPRARTRWPRAIPILNTMSAGSWRGEGVGDCVQV
jgi:hypothetical protein